ncbi:electron transfer flavoprotein subunit beta/FixA family protein [Syntrophorhabdus aromaticivorans]|uniref:Protein FixA n=1 Tax=Syntrophorhabdus aromaticivorans TaxID=328301 RepID=A0A351U512_9BACT|nr:electron transfer flavoprotein subunit beta/FixA family protein [Syntrophorhabdus aromaticivorans]NLW34136.1 electron transfer flavoprotein subunit beta/FixA family protein [Syntrophorhabdus aromaticivorans]HBA55043.1 electron transfer flavoprotein subunit beta/FixA family protein [Syntrophorhabdus aromaticivorans]
MKIVACIKQVPDTEAEVKWDIPNGRLNREGMDSVTNPFDEFALEEALLTRENYDGELIAITMGPEKAADVLRNCLALTVNEVHQCTDAAFAGSDTFATASVLAAAIKKIGDVDVVFCGKQSTDGNTGVVGAVLASILGFSQLTFVSKVRSIDAGAKKIVVERAIEGGTEVVEAKLPAVVSVIKGINEPRLPNLMGIRKAAKMQIPQWSAADLGVDAGKVGAAGSCTKVVEIAVPPPRGAGEILKGEIDDIANTVTDKLIDLKVIK